MTHSYITAYNIADGKFIIDFFTPDSLPAKLNKPYKKLKEVEEEKDEKHILERRLERNQR